MLIQEVLQFFKSRQAIADALDISVQAVHQWGDVVPPLREYQLRDIEPKLNKRVST